MNKVIASLFAAALLAIPAKADVGAPAPSAKDLEAAIEDVNHVETAQKGIVLSGYVDVGYIYNFTGNDNGATGIPTRFDRDETSKGDFNVNAVKLVLEKPLSDANELQAGFRADLMVGEDASYLGGNGGAGALTSDSLFVEQAYVTLRAPIGNGLDFKIGKFVTWLGYEVIERPANLNITYGNLFENMIPLYHTGVSAEYSFNDTVDAGFALVNGYNGDDNFGPTGIGEDGYGIMGKINITNPSGNANLYSAVYYSWDSSFEVTGADKDDVVIVDVWGNWVPEFSKDKLLLGVNFDYGYSDSDTIDDSTWWGAALYAKYQFTDIFSLAARADYMYNDDDTKFGIGSGSNDDVWSWTLTAGFDLVENLLLRAEYRLDFGDDVEGTGNDGPAHTFAAQAVYSF